MKVISVSLKVRSVHSNLEKNSCLNACVLLRSCFDVFKTLDPIFAKFNFAKGLAKVSLGELIDGS